MKRKISNKLEKWKKSDIRKVLLVRGARQVGKTYSIRKLGESFNHYLEVNFEEEPDVKALFDGSRNPFPICRSLSDYFNIPIIEGKTLLFFDEIQACPNCIRALRFFYEKMPGLHVAAAGSLLEFVLEDIPSFGVGRISSLHMYPMTFCEFLAATGENGLVNSIKGSSPASPVNSVLHEKLLKRLKEYLIVGGMPEAVQAYANGKTLRECQRILDDLLKTLRDDFAKYRKRTPVLQLQETLRSISGQAGNKFKYSKIGSEATTYTLKASLELLVRAGLAYKACHTSARGIPLGAQVNLKKFKVLPLDSGIHLRMLGLDISKFLFNDTAVFINKGNMAEIFAGLELISGGSAYSEPQLFYWHRESKSSNAELDYIIQQGERIIPIEVKSGLRGKMRSMHLFLNERNYPKGYRISQENFTKYGNIQVVPLYAAGKIVSEEWS